MGRTGTASMPLHRGRAPGWLFDRMRDLAGAVSEVVLEEYSRDELLRRISDPRWFQALGCVLGYDWHSSGLTTVTCAALKEALDGEEHGVEVAGGKGRTSLRTPDEISGSRLLPTGRLEPLVEASGLSAKVDSGCVQDGYELYHHAFFFTEDGRWAVVQQGMDGDSGMARRYHWLSSGVESFVEEPHAGLSAERVEERALDLTSSLSGETREVSVDLVNDGPGHLERFSGARGQSSLSGFRDDLEMPRRHEVRVPELTGRTLRNLEEAGERSPSDFRELVSLEGVGGESLRALALVSQLVHGAEADWRDPARYAYAHGGKDGTPYPVDRGDYDGSIRVLREALEMAEVGDRERLDALERLNRFL